MSEHKESLVKVLEYLVNDEQDKAADLLHTVFVEKAKTHWSSITESDEVVEDEIAEDEDLDETIDLDEADDDSEDDEVEEAIDASDAEEDFLDDIETAEEEIDDEEIMDDEDMTEPEAEMDLAMDMDMDGEEEGEAEEGEAADAEEAMDNVEDAIAELRAAFADLMGDEAEEEEAEESVEMEAEEVEPMEEGATLTAVNVSHADGSDSGKSPVGSGAGNAMASPHSTDTKEGPKASAPSVGDMGVRGPQEAGDLSAAPAPKSEDHKSASPIRGMK